MLCIRATLGGNVLCYTNGKDITVTNLNLKNHFIQYSLTDLTGVFLS